MFTPVQINHTKNVIQAQIHNEQPIRDTHTTVILGYLKTPKPHYPLHCRKTWVDCGAESGCITLPDQPMSHEEKASKPITAAICHRSRSVNCKLLLSWAALLKHYSMLSTHLTHTETLYKRSFEVVQDKENSKQKKKPWQINFKCFIIMQHSYLILRKIAKTCILIHKKANRYILKKPKTTFTQ